MNNHQTEILQHIDKIEQFAKRPGNEWLIVELGKRFGNYKINEIYEHCIEKIIKTQAEKFYKDFPIKELVPQLMEDFCRMERFRRIDNFEDFCLSLFQQVENITNWFCLSSDFNDLYNNKKNEECSIKNNKKEDIIIEKLIINSDYDKRKGIPLMDMYFNERIRAVLYFVYFKEHPYNNYVFEVKSGDLDSLYQCRNLNHRGGKRNDYQDDKINTIIPNKYQYYLKFTGLLVDFVEQVTKQRSTIEEYGSVSNKFESGYVYIKPDSRDSFCISRGKHLYSKVKNYNVGDRVCIITNKSSREIVDIKRIMAK